LVEDDTTPDTVVNFIVNTDVDWTGGSSEDGIEQIFLTTNGDITATELVGDMLVGHIHSTGGDVTLFAPIRILDADGQPTIDVTGDDITMTAGTDGGQGGVGTPTDFLEINVDRNTATGVLTVTDTAGNSTLGVFLSDLLGRMRVDLVHTEGDVSLRTVDGSILEGRKDGVASDKDFEADVIGNSIDIDANGSGADIGALGNDLEIDSSVYATGDVGLEAASDIYVTETGDTLRLVLAHAYTGNIRITVRDSGGLPENDDLVLLASGSSRFAENNATAGGSDPDAPRTVAHGQVFAEQGSVTLLVGDDITLDDNSQIVANLDIEIYGDANFYDGVNQLVDPDAGYGTDMVLRGRIIANAHLVTAGAQTGLNPIGVAESEVSTGPVYQTNIWGNGDSDYFQFGGVDGDSGTTTWGVDEYIFLGSKTRVHGGQTTATVGTIALPGNDGEDRFAVYYLQDTATVTSPVSSWVDPVAGGTDTVALVDGVPILDPQHTLTLDGQADTDHYEVYTLGSNGADDRNYVINVLDTGMGDDGVDEMTIYGYDNKSDFDGFDTNGNKLPTDDLFLLRSASSLPGETADRPAYVAMLYGQPTAYADTIENNEDSTEVARINYDTGLNGRLTIEALGGNDAFFSDDATVIVSLQGGAGADSFQIGQIFGTKRTEGGEHNTDGPGDTEDQTLIGGALLAQDVFPDMVATTRGWLSPGISAPLVAQGGTGNDEFRVYSNQAELRLEGDDNNDLFIVRAFAIAAVANQDWNEDGTIDQDDLPAVDVDTNGDGVINFADADSTPDDYTDDVIVRDEFGVAMPIIGLGFSVARAPDIRAGGGEDEVQYNVNAPVSVDGGTGFDKLVILATEFADDIAITEKAIYGAGLNVRYTTIEVVEIDGLEGDDEFFVQSTAFGVAYRVIGGLGSDTINVTGDVTEDIVTRELEGASGAVDHLVRSEGDRFYDGVVVDGFDYNVASASEGVVVIKESNGFTAVREGGPVKTDSYTVELAVQPLVGQVVYVTVSAARSTQEEEDDTLNNPPPLTDGVGDSIWLSALDPGGIVTDSDFQRTITVNGSPVVINNRSVVLTFTHANWATPQTVHVYAPDDPRSEGDRVVVVQHSVISDISGVASGTFIDHETGLPVDDEDYVDPFDAADVRNVEVQVRDNDTPGVYVVEVAKGTSTEDGRTLVIEGDDTTPTELTDEVLVSLAKAPAGLVVVKLELDTFSDDEIAIFDVADPTNTNGRMYKDADGYWRIRFDTAASASAYAWNDQVRVGIQARKDITREDPHTAVVHFVRDDAATVDTSYVFPNLRSGLGLLDIEVIDNETAGAVVLESGGSTLMKADGSDSDTYEIRLTKAPLDEVEVAVLTDGLADVVSIDGTPITPDQYEIIGGLQATQMFEGTLIFANDSGFGKVTRGTGEDLGSFIDEGFHVGQHIRIGTGNADFDGDYYITAIDTEGQWLKVDAAFGGAGTPVEVKDDAILADLASVGTFTGKVVFTMVVENGVNTYRMTMVHADGTPLGDKEAGWLGFGFLEGQRIRLAGANAGDYKIALIRGENDAKDDTIQFTAENTPIAVGGGALSVTVNRTAAVVTFDASNYHEMQQVELRADTNYDVPVTREGVKVFPVTTHYLSKLRGPLAVEGGPSGADRSLQNGLKLPGEADDFLIAIGAQPPESQQIDVLNIFNDTSKEDGNGVMTETTLRGFNMANDLDFGALYGLTSTDVGTFGESLVVPGGISFGKISFGTGGFSTNNTQSTIEVLNVMLGEGNDDLQIIGTLNPADSVEVTRTFDITASETTPAGTTGATIRLEGFDWKANGFLVGQKILIDGIDGGWTVKAIDDDWAYPDNHAEGTDPNDNSILVLNGSLADISDGSHRITALDKDVVTNNATVSVQATQAGGVITRTDGGDWDLSFDVGQFITIDGDFAKGEYQIVAIATDSMTVIGGQLAPVSEAGRTIRKVGGGVVVTTEVDIDPNYTGGLVTRSTGSWTQEGYLAGHLVTMVDGNGKRDYRIVEISDDAKTLTLEGAPLANQTNVTKSFYVQGIHGGLNLIHGGGNFELESTGDMVFANTSSSVAGAAKDLTRLDGRAWSADRYQVGQIVQLEGESFTRTILALENADLNVTPKPSNSALSWGQGSRMVLGAPNTHAGSGTVVQLANGAHLASGTGAVSLHVAEPFKAVATGTMSIATTSTDVVNNNVSTITRTSGSWLTDGFYLNQVVYVSGLAGGFTVSALTASTMTLQNVALTPQTDVQLSVFGYDATRDGGKRVGGDHIVVGHTETTTLAIDAANKWLTRGDGEAWDTTYYHEGQQIQIAGIDATFRVSKISASTLNGPKDRLELTKISGSGNLVSGTVSKTIVFAGIAGPDSPLVIYGDTSQDGMWFSGHSYDVLGLELGEKPFDPFPQLPDGENEDDEWVFPLANPYDLAGNDVIDASLLFAGVFDASLPSVGLTIYGGAGNDTVIGSQAGDHLAGGSGDDTILGQRGVDHIYGDSGVNVNVLTRALTISTVDRSPEPTLDKGLLSNGTTIPPAPSPVRDAMVAGRDVIHGDGPGTIAGGPESAYDDILFGDHGAIVQNVADPNAPEPLLQRILTTALSSVLLVRSAELQNGDDDVIFGHLGRDIVIGGAGHDMADGDEADDLVFGDNVTSLTRRGGDDGNLADDITSGRFQTLAGTLLYSRTDRPVPAGFATPTADTSGQLLVDGVARDYRDPDGAPWWAEYRIDYADLHTHAFDKGTTGVGSFGNDYLAGGAKHDLVFGQLGHDLIQGDGGIEDASSAVSHVGASRTPDPAAGTVFDLVGDLDVVASFEDAANDGQDYIEGGGGNDVVFGGLGQDDILGGNSDFFSLSTPDRRPDGDDLIFGGAGTDISRSNPGDADVSPAGVITTKPTGHADDADTIVGDNGRIVRIVGVGKTDGMAADPAKPYVTFNYDDYGPVKIIVRGVDLLDYTPGGPDFRPDLFGSGPYAAGGLVSKIDIGGRDEVHGESGDDTIYVGAAADVVYGDGQDDDIVLGWGDDWASGGTGQDGILGDDGRIATSRNSKSANPASPGYLVSPGEPLYGVAPLLAADPDTKFNNGNVLNEFIYTPGMVQTATVNVSGALNKAFDITPYDWRPNALGADDPLFDANDADDVIYGGLGDDFLHGAVGDDAISGAEALLVSYSQLYDFETAELLGVVRSDWTRPYNTGDMLVFGNDDDSWHAKKPSLPGEFALYDEFDPRRVITLLADGTKVSSGTVNGYNWFLNFVSNEGPTFPGGVTEKGVPYPQTWNDGRDVVFGDQGNDWAVGGTGRDDLFGGWGTDLLNADDLLGTTGGATPGAGYSDDAPDTSPNYEDRAFAGAGYDILIGNTGGDRLIDWVGEFNSYIVPFAPFGIDTVSRQRPPMLDEFLYALSRADGADPTRWHDTTSDPAFLPRNGEPFGELGLITQKDHGLWQDQTGGPTDPQPGNIPGGKRDVLNSADFNDGSQKNFRADSGVWEVKQGSLNVGAASLGKDALGIFYLDNYLPLYYEISASIRTEKPTGGWKSNAYVVFDYFSPTDFKFAGIDVATNKFVMGHRAVSGWVVDVQSPLQVKPDTFYKVLVAVNGTSVTVQVDGKQAFVYAFPARVIDGVAYGLNKGMVGAGSDNARGTWDDFAVQVLPPQLTLDATEDFNDGVADRFTGARAGAPWTVAGGRYAATAATGTTSLQLVDLGVDHLQASSYLELQATLRTTGIGGMAFDGVGPEHYKFVALDVAGQRVILGHYQARRGWVVDTSVSHTLAANTDYTLGLTLKGASASVTLNGAFALSWGFNSPVVDGAVGVLSRVGTSSFDSFRIRTNDPAFRGLPLLSASAVLSPAKGAAPLTDSQLHPILEAAVERWKVSRPDATGLDAVTARVEDLPGDRLAQAMGDVIVVDATAADFGWFIDATPWEDSEYVLRTDDSLRLAIDSSPADGRMDLLTVVMHELGHVLGLEDLEDEGHAHELMAEVLDAGTRRLPGEATPTVDATDHGRSPARDGEPEVGRAPLTSTASEPRATAASPVPPSPRQVVPGPQEVNGAGTRRGAVAPARASGPIRPIRISGSPPRPEAVDVILAGLGEQPLIQDLHWDLLRRNRRTRKS
jgi:hypothetical protein